MTWSWSHTQEAYSNARARLEALPITTLREIWAEWKAGLTGTDDCGEPRFSSHKYARALKRAEKHPADILAEEVWSLMEEQARCDNGGWNAHCCPYGCGPHCVPFDPVEETDESADA